MSKRLLSMILSLCLIMTAVPATIAYGASEPTENELKDLFEAIGFAGALTGSEAEFDDDENVDPYMAYWFMNVNGRLNQYFNEETWYYELTIDQYMAAVDSAFTNYDEDAIKTWLTECDYYDASVSNEVKIYPGGIGDVWAWEPLAIDQSGSTYTITGLFLYGNDETGDVTASDVEFYDYWTYTATWTDENGNPQSMTYPMHIEYGITVTVENTDDGLKVSSYDETPYYTYNGVTYCQNESTGEFDQSFKVTLGYTSTAYSGSYKKPSVTVKDKNGTKLGTAKYDVDYSKNKNPGIAKVEVEIDYGNYECEVIKTFKIKLKTPSVKATTVASSGKIKVSWASVYKASKYKVYRATSKNGTYKLLKTTTAKSYTDTSAVAEKTYYYKVMAVYSSNTALNSAKSSYVSKVCDLAKPVITVKRNSSGDPKVTWKKVSGADKYYVYRATSKTGKYTRVKITTSKYYTDTTAKAGKTYYYKVKAVSTKTSDANSAFSAIKSCKAR